MKTGFTLMETLAALAVTALMLTGILTAQSVILRATRRTQVEARLRFAAESLFTRTLLELPRDENAVPAGVVWRIESPDRENKIDYWLLSSAEMPEAQLRLCLQKFVHPGNR